MPRLFIYTHHDFNTCVITLNVELADTIGNIKARALNLIAVQTLNGAALSTINDRLVDTLMEDRHTLMHYNIREGDTLSMYYTEL